MKKETGHSQNAGKVPHIDSNLSACQKFLSNNGDSCAPSHGAKVGMQMEKCGVLRKEAGLWIALVDAHNTQLVLVLIPTLSSQVAIPMGKGFFCSITLPLEANMSQLSLLILKPHLSLDIPSTHFGLAKRKVVHICSHTFILLDTDLVGKVAGRNPWRTVPYSDFDRPR